MSVTEADRDWMRRIEAEQEAERQRESLRAKDSALLDALMKTEAAELWKRLTNELNSLAQLSAAKIGVRLACSEIPSSEPMLRIVASPLGIAALRHAYMDVFYVPQEYQIRCLAPFLGTNQPYVFQFCILNNALEIFDGIRTLTPEQIANKLAETLVEEVRKQR